MILKSKGVPQNRVLGIFWAELGLFHCAGLEQLFCEDFLGPPRAYMWLLDRRMETGQCNSLESKEVKTNLYEKVSYGL